MDVVGQIGNERYPPALVRSSGPILRGFERRQRVEDAVSCVGHPGIHHGATAVVVRMAAHGAADLAEVASEVAAEVAAPEPTAEARVLVLVLVRRTEYETLIVWAAPIRGLRFDLLTVWAAPIRGLQCDLHRKRNTREPMLPPMSWQH